MRGAGSVTKSQGSESGVEMGCELGTQGQGGPEQASHHQGPNSGSGPDLGESYDTFSRLALRSCNSETLPLPGNTHMRAPLPTGRHGARLFLTGVFK